jgi:hypothetical protein
MADGFEVVPDFLAEMANALRSAGRKLGGIDIDATAPDAGEATGDLAAVMAALLASTAELVDGVTFAGAGVAATAAEYQAQEQANASRLR